MKTLISSLFLLLGISLVTAQTYLPTANDTLFKTTLQAPIKAYAFNLEDVQLKESVFKEAMDAHEAYLRELEPDRFLAQFRTNAGLAPKGKKYGGWEDMGLAGHSLGHYLSACAIFYSITKDQVFLDKVNYIVDELALCQKERGTGYVGAIPNEDQVFYKVALGNISSRGFDLNGAWAPWYTIHKLMAGLLDAYKYTGNTKALEVDKGIADWTDNLLRGLTYDEIQKMLRCEYGGMNETLANTYALTGNEKYLKLSHKFHDNFVVDSLEVKHNPFPGKHSNTNIPKAIAAIRQYELTGDEKAHTAGNFTWEAIVNHHTYAPGGNGNYEYFGPEDALNNTLTDNTMETCSTYNMLKLTEHLFTLDPEAKYMDYYERAMYNHILASQNRENAMTTYFMPLRMGTKKWFSDAENTFTCCVGSSMENQIKYGSSIFYQGADGSLYVNLFIPSELDWKAKNAKIILDTELPKTDHFTLTVKTTEKQEFPIKIRKPYWLEGTPSISINGKILKSFTSTPEGYLVISKKWKNNDKITVTLPMGIHQMAMPDNPARQTFFYGPIVIAGDLGKDEPEPATGTPVFVTDKTNPEEWIKLQDKNSLTFVSQNTGEPNEVVFKPFYEFTDHYYNVYWDVFSSPQWQTQQKEYEAEKIKTRELENRTVDILRVGEMQPERDHNFEGENLNTGESHTRKFRTAANGGSMHFTLKTDTSIPNELILTYWGMDNRGRVFDILVDGKKIAQADINNYKDSKFYDISYDIPAALTQGKTEVTVQLQALPKNEVGPIYGVRMVKVVKD